jgi:hypothetical protein
MNLRYRTPNDVVLLLKEAHWLIGQLLADNVAIKADAEAWRIEVEDDLREAEPNDDEEYNTMQLWRIIAKAKAEDAAKGRKQTK